MANIWQVLHLTTLLLGYVHAMAHQLGGFYNLPSGVCNAILLPYVERFNLIGNLNRFRDIAEAMGENIEGLSTHEAALKAIASIRTLSMEVGVPARVEGIGSKTGRASRLWQRTQRRTFASSPIQEKQPKNKSSKFIVKHTRVNCKVFSVVYIVPYIKQFIQIKSPWQVECQGLFLNFILREIPCET